MFLGYFLREIASGATFSRPGRLFRFLFIPPLPPLAIIFRIITLAGNCRNPHGKGLRGQNLDSKGLSPRPLGGLGHCVRWDHHDASRLWKARSTVTFLVGWAVEKFVRPESWS